jgi:hypothetical protein
MTIQLLDKDGNRWFTPRWELNFLDTKIHGYNKISLSKTYDIK